MSATIFNTIRKADGSVQQNTTVQITLSWDTSASAIAKNDDGDYTIQGPFRAVSDLDGYWEVELVDNESILPANSVYKIVEEVSDGDSTNTYYVSIQAAATGNVWVGDILASKPAWEE